MRGPTVFVISGGPIGDLTFLHAQLEALVPMKTVCADGGARHLDALGIAPQVIIGDMDSLEPDLLLRMEGRGSRIIRHPVGKDRTDTWLALEYALDLEPEQVVIFGALGGRVDHTLANVSLLALAAERGVAAKLIDEWGEMSVVAGNGKAVIDGETGQTVSLLPLTTRVAGITLTGFEYSLDNGTMEIGKPYGISNRLIAENGTVAVASGMLLVIRYFRPGMFPEGA